MCSACPLRTEAIGLNTMIADGRGHFISSIFCFGGEGGGKACAPSGFKVMQIATQEIGTSHLTEFSKCQM